ncbi:putative oxidative stress response protein Oxr1 [Aspergillus novofumigatus IBT 16806]|uniref:Oxidation resistance protein 1 n=1 Tax=Aspergillus novofumigatus (strain IBT 16806) TaxID=1392255 RepID=A0A2I1C2R2_ASPN1|nr:TLD domain-containing protein [Aspergillus novofumigatus IBT 16806]PKX91909.1 TLD domain-containing protein [Aspergillus novofumigatus IBT 16806]
MSSLSQGDSPSSTATPSSSSSSSASGSRAPKANTPFNQSAASYFSYPVTHVVSGLYRRLTDPNIAKASRKDSNSPNRNMNARNNYATPTTSPDIFIPIRTASPFQPPPLTPLTLTPGPGIPQQQLLTRALAEEIRLLVPARLQLVDTWRLAYSLDRDGASLSTLYEHCREFSHRSPRAGYVLIVRDSSPAGECFLWRASVLPSPTNLLNINGPQSEEMLERAGLPLPPSADTTHAGRSTTLRGDSRGHGDGRLAAPRTSGGAGAGAASGASTPERIRFKAFPYSGVNDYMMFCETGFLSLGGGDGHYGLWVDSSLEKGVSASCQTFGNEPLSDEGVKFDVLGVEVWYVGA